MLIACRALRNVGLRNILRTHPSTRTANGRCNLAIESSFESDEIAGLSRPHDFDFTQGRGGSRAYVVALQHSDIPSEWSVHNRATPHPRLSVRPGRCWKTRCFWVLVQPAAVINCQPIRIELLSPIDRCSLSTSQANTPVSQKACSRVKSLSTADWGFDHGYRIHLIIAIKYIRWRRQAVKRSTLFMKQTLRNNGDRCSSDK